MATRGENDGFGAVVVGALLIIFIYVIGVIIGSLTAKETVSDGFRAVCEYKGGQVFGTACFDPEDKIEIPEEK